MKNKILLILLILITFCCSTHTAQVDFTELPNNDVLNLNQFGDYYTNAYFTFAESKRDKAVVMCATIQNEENVKEKEPVKYKKENEEKQKIKEMKQKMKEIDSIEDKQKWFIKYKKIIKEYKDVVSPPESIYDCYSDNELDIFFRVVQAEIGDEYTFEQKCNVASVIINRIKSDTFPNDMFGVLSRKQFQTVASGIYKKVDVSDSTILACEYSHMIEDTTGGALYYLNKKCSTKKNIRWFENNLIYLFTDGAGHSFYK